MSWIPTTPDDERAMLEAIGVLDIEALFAAIPKELRTQRWSIPEGLPEIAVQRHCEALAAQNDTSKVCFLGGGYYDHYIPPAVDALTARSEFYTAYTPYQPECSQGTLQSIYEYQSMICRITDMDFANASLYDGGTAVFEAVGMAVRITGRRKIALLPGVNPHWKRMLYTHTANWGLTFTEWWDEPDLACVVAQSPDFYGTIHPLKPIADAAHQSGALFIHVFYPLSLGVLQTPGEVGADIAVAEGQSLGLPLGFGGPYLGILATRRDYVRKMPGRIAGETTDAQGRRGFVLTLQAREQHIRREKAMSNICSNQALCALRALIYLSLLGPQGFVEVAQACHAKAEYLKRHLQDIASIQNPGPTFHEFVVRLPISAEIVCERMAEKGFLAGLPLCAVEKAHENDLLVAVTEKRTRTELDAYVTAIKECVCN